MMHTHNHQKSCWKSTSVVPKLYWSGKCQEKVCLDVGLGHGASFLQGPPAKKNLTFFFVHVYYYIHLDILKKFLGKKCAQIYLRFYNTWIIYRNVTAAVISFYSFPVVHECENVSFLDQIIRDKITDRDKEKQKEKKKHRLMSEIKKENGEMKLFQKGNFWTLVICLVHKISNTVS